MKNSKIMKESMLDCFSSQKLEKAFLVEFFTETDDGVDYFDMRGEAKIVLLPKNNETLNMLDDFFIIGFRFGETPRPILKRN